MKIWICLLTFMTLLPVNAQVRPRDVFKIEIGSDYDRYSERELRRRVWELERAVAQLQDQVFQLAMDKKKYRPKYKSYRKKWTCHMKSFGKTFSATKSTRGEALAKVLKECSKHTSAVHCDEDGVSCSDK